MVRRRFFFASDTSSTRFPEELGQIAAQLTTREQRENEFVLKKLNSHKGKKKNIFIVSKITQLLDLSPVLIPF